MGAYDGVATLDSQSDPNPYASAGAVLEQPTLRPSVDREMQGIDQRIAAARPEGRPVEAESLVDAIEAGWQVSTSGLIKRGKNPDTILPEHAPLMYKIAAGLTTLAGDVPTMLAGIGLAAPLEAPAAAGGAALGAMTGPLAPVATPVGALVGGAIPAGAAAFGLPEWMRAGLMDYYAKGGQHSEDYVSALASSFLSKRALGAGAKGAVVGGLTAGAGAPVRAVSTIAGATTEVATMTTVSAALNGQMPKAEDFVVAAATLAVMHGGAAAFSKAPELTENAAAWLREHYAKTGENPHDVAARVAGDPVARQSIFEDIKARDAASGYVYDAYHGTNKDFSQFDLRFGGSNTGVQDAKGAIFFSEDPKIASGYADYAAKNDVADKIDVTRSDLLTEYRTKFLSLQDQWKAGEIPQADFDAKISELTKERDAKIAEIPSGTMQGGNVLPVRLKLSNPAVIDFRGEPYNAPKFQLAIQQAKVAGRDGVIFKNVDDSLKGTDPKTVYAVFKPDQIRGRFGALEGEGSTGATPNKPLVDSQSAGGEQPPQTPKEKILGRIGEPGKRGYTWDDFRYDFVNDLQHANAAVRDALSGTGKKLETYKNPAEQLRLAYGAHGWAENIMQRDLKPLVAPIMKAKKWDDFVSYMVSKRVLEKEEQGVPTGFDIEAARSEVARATPEFKEAARAVIKYQDAWIDRAVKAGVLSEKQREAYKEFNADYIPFNRVMDDVPPAGKGGPGGFRVRNPAKEMTGSEKQIINPFDSVVKNSYTWAQMIRNNEALTRLADFSKSLPADRQFLAPSKRQISVTELSEKDSQLAKFLDEHGIDPSEANGIMIYRAAQKVLDKNEIMIFKDGKPTIYEAKDANLIKSLTKMDQTTYNALVKVLRVPAAAFRAGTTLVPEFMAKNLIRDQLSGFIQNTFKTVPFLDFAVGFKTLLTDPKAVDKWAESGGMNSAMLSVDKDIFQKDFFALDKSQALPTKRVWNAVATLFRMFQGAGMLIENATRLGQNIRAKKEGLSDIEAAMRSRDVSLDFYRMGARVRAFNAIGSFLGPSINGMDRLVEAFKTDPHGTTLRAAAAVTMPTILLWWANHDEDWYKQQPQWLKDTTWMFKAGDTIIKIPKPPLYGTLFGAIPERVLEAYANDNPDAWYQIGRTLMQDWAPFDSAIPVAVSPIVEVATNWNFFTDQPLVTAQMEESYLPPYRYNAYSTETAKQLAKLIPEFVADRFRTPAAIDHLVKAWTSGLGTYVAQIADQGLYASGVAERPVNPSATLADIPFVKAFVVRNPSANTDAIEKFYERTASAYQTLGTYKMLMQQGKIDEAQAVLDGGRDVLKLGQMHEAMANMRRSVRSIYENRDISPDEKRQLIDNIYGAMNQLAETGVIALNASRQ